MKTLTFRSSVRAAVILSGLLLPRQVHAQDSVAAARDLYASAAYDEALGVLNRLDLSGRKPSDRVEVNQYRAFCLVALRRTDEAEKAIEADRVRRAAVPPGGRRRVAEADLGVRHGPSANAAGHRAAEVRACEGGV